MVFQIDHDKICYINKNPIMILAEKTPSQLCIVNYTKIIKIKVMIDFLTS